MAGMPRITHLCFKIIWFATVLVGAFFEYHCDFVNIVGVPPFAHFMRVETLMGVINLILIC
jgi:hypothetical protein